MKSAPWEEAKRRAREIDPTWDSPERIAARDESREQMRAEQRGHQLADLRKQCGATQAQVAELMGVRRPGRRRSSTARLRPWIWFVTTSSRSEEPGMLLLTLVIGASKSLSSADALRDVESETRKAVRRRYSHREIGRIDRRVEGYSTPRAIVMTRMMEQLTRSEVPVNPLTGTIFESDG